MRTTIAVVAAVLVVAVLGLFLHFKGASPPPPAERFTNLETPGDELPRLWKPDGFRFPNQGGVEVSDATLAGRPWIVDFIFTQCTTACPVMTSRMVLLQRELAGADVRFVSASVDPEHDQPAALAAYAQRWNPTETRWDLLATDRPGLAKLLDAFHIHADKGTDEKNPIIHSAVFLLVDREGWVRGVYDLSERRQLLRLAAHARRLAGGSDRPVAADGTPEPLLTAMGCQGCHFDKRVAPPLGGLPGHEITLEDGMKLVADEAYLRRAIVTPGVEVSAGYAALMPSYEGVLTPAQVDQLLAEIRALPAVDRPEGPPVALAIDPVCEMTVRAAPETIHAEVGGKTYYFCAEGCRDSFIAHPEWYPPKK